MSVGSTDVVFLEDVGDVLCKQLLVLAKNVLIDRARILRYVLNVFLQPCLELFRRIFMLDSI